jgi:hypothetical protein
LFASENIRVGENDPAHDLAQLDIELSALVGRKIAKPGPVAMPLRSSRTEA